MNVLVNDGLSIVTHQLDLILPPETPSEIIQLPTLEQKRFLRDLRSGKVMHICILVAEDECVPYIRSEMVLAENERILSRSSMDEIFLDEKTRIERYDFQPWDSLKATPHFDDLMEFKDVLPETVPCELPKDKGTRYKIDLKSGSK